MRQSVPGRRRFRTNACRRNVCSRATKRVQVLSLDARLVYTNSPAFTAWHHDATYFGIDPLEHVTAWVALSDASREAGCMDVLTQRGKPRQFRHEAKRLEHSINTEQTHHDYPNAQSATSR